MIHKASAEIGGLEFSIEMGRIAKQAEGAAFVSYGDTVVLATACSHKKPREGVDFLPLTVDYRENTYAAGKIPGGFFKREGRPTEKEILTSRLIDRPLRPLFPEGFNHETQIVALVLSADKENDPDVMSITGASAALYCSAIPFFNPIAGVRVGLMDGNLVVNPPISKLKDSRLNLTVAGHRRRHRHGGSGGGRDPRRTDGRGARVCARHHPAADRAAEGTIRQDPARETGSGQARPGQGRVRAHRGRLCREDFRSAAHQGQARSATAASTRSKKRSSPPFPKRKPTGAPRRARSTTTCMEKIFRKEILQDRMRPDGRQFDEIRPIGVEVGLLPADARFGPVHARRNAGARDRHPGDGRRRAAHGHPGRGVVQAVHAPLQLPALQRRRGQVPARPRPAGNRARRAGRAQHRLGHALGGSLPVYRAGRVRHPREQRFVLDGHHLRRHPVPDGCRGSDQGSGGRAWRWGWSRKATATRS